MKANKTDISLETAKLLKDCGVESKEYYWSGVNELDIYISDKPLANFDNQVAPAYTWQQILWENRDKFLSGINIPAYDYYLLKLLQQKKYEEADKYLREHTILIKEPPRGTKNMEKETLEELIEILESDIRIFGACGDDLTRLNNLNEQLEELEENEIS
jgi:hypothetical protein